MNKTMDRTDLELDAARLVIKELDTLLLTMRDAGVHASSWYGCFDIPTERKSLEVINRGYNYQPLRDAIDDDRFPWFLFWEIAWVTMNADFRSGQKVLDLGGCSSLFSFYLASKGLEVTAVDLQKSLVDNANFVASRMGWNLSNHVMDMRTLKLDAKYDHVTSICVYEHIPMYERVKINKTISETLLPRGRFSITFDYKNPSRFARINSPRNVYDQFVKPSGLQVRGNVAFIDNGRLYLLHPFFHPRTPLRYKLRNVKNGQFRPWRILQTKRHNDYTFGALFLEKR